MFGFMKSPQKIYVLFGLLGGILLTACQPAPAEPAVVALPTLASIAVVPTTDSASAPLPTALFPTSTPAVVAQQPVTPLPNQPLPTAASVIVPTPVGFVPTATPVVLSLAPKSINTTSSGSTASTSTTSSGSTTISDSSSSGSLPPLPFPTMSAAELEDFYAAGIMWMDKLKTCTPYSQTVTIPIFNRPHTNTIIGREGDICLVKMANETGIFDCRFNQEAINFLTRDELYEELESQTLSISTTDSRLDVLNEQCVITALDYQP